MHGPYIQNGLISAIDLPKDVLFLQDQIYWEMLSARLLWNTNRHLFLP